MRVFIVIPGPNGDPPRAQAGSLLEAGTEEIAAGPPGGIGAPPVGADLPAPGRIEPFLKCSLA